MKIILHLTSQLRWGDCKDIDLEPSKIAVKISIYSSVAFFASHAFSPISSRISLTDESAVSQPPPQANFKACRAVEEQTLP